MNDRQDEARRMGAVVEDGLCSPFEIALLEQRAAGVQITIVVWEIAARNFNSEPMAGLHHVARRPQINRIFVHLSWCEQRGMGLRTPIARSDYSILDILRIAV